MILRRKLLISAILLVCLGALAFFFWRHAVRPPDAVRLLPEGDVLVYANLQPLHLFEFGKSRPVQIEGDYRDFIDQTGIQLERDLEQVAMSRRDTPDGKDTESSEIFAGKFDQQRLQAYLEKISSRSEAYRNHTIYSVQHEGHLVRVSILDAHRVAVTNMDSPEPMRGIIDTFYHPPHGPSLLHDYYSRVPGTALAWLIARTPANSKAAQFPNGWSFDFLENTITVASLRYQGDALFQADVIAPTDSDAKRVSDAVTTFLWISRSAAQTLNPRGTDPDVKAAFDSIQVGQNKNVAVVTATLSQRMLKKLVTEAQPESTAPVPSPSPEASKHRRRRR
ncbi:MAG TPA: hypothetical protein VJN64_10485 [Terriglobales bacterium]|nr:hypothetical protein [Terriglobales bacterium]